jgi:hypothetical protein
MDFGRLSQVALVGYGVGGAFLGLAYFDLPYTLMAFIACTYAVVQREAARLSHAAAVNNQKPGLPVAVLLGKQPAARNP